MDRTQLAVVGAGPAGLTAALEAARLGLEVTLIDEHPIEFALMAQEIPLHFGQRMMATVGNRADMLSRVVAANSKLEQAENAGVELHLGAMVWDSSGDQVLALADDVRSWRLGYEAAIFAPGARDLGVAFPGWDLAGVVGARGLLTLLDRYQAFSDQLVTVLGSGDLGLQVAHEALYRGVEVAAVVDISAEVRGQAGLKEDLEKVPFRLGHIAEAARGDTEVTSLVIRPIDGNGSTEIECDTICLAIGLVPNIELLYWAGCDIRFDPYRGGFIPSGDEKMHTTHKGIFVAGDAAGFTEEGFVDLELAAAQGWVTAVSAAEHLGAIDAEKAGLLRGELQVPMSSKVHDGVQYLQAWLDSIEARAKLDTPVCICEKVTRRDLSSMIERGPIHPDHVKRLTRAGMGYCQGRRCREQIQLITSRFTGQQIQQIPLAYYRPPFRPTPLGVIQNRDLAAEEEQLLFGEYHHRLREEYLQATGGTD